MLFLLALSAFWITVCKADPTNPTCSPIYGTSIDFNDCYAALEHPYISALWTRMSSTTNTIRPSGSSVFNLRWHPILDSPSAAGPLSNDSAATSESPLFSDHDIANDSAILARFRLSRKVAYDDPNQIFRLPMVRIHQSCAIGVDLAHSAVPHSYKASDRILDAFRAIERVVTSCTDSAGTTRGQGGFAGTPDNELLAVVTKPALLQDLPSSVSISLGHLIALRVAEVS